MTGASIAWSLALSVGCTAGGDTGSTAAGETAVEDSGVDSGSDSTGDTATRTETATPGDSDTGETGHAGDTGDTAPPCWGPDLLAPGTYVLDELEGQIYTYSAVRIGRRGDIDGDGRLDLVWAGGTYLNGNRGPICGEFDAWEDPAYVYVHDPVDFGFAGPDFETAALDGDGTLDLLVPAAGREREDGLLGEYYLILGPHDVGGYATPDSSADTTFVHSTEKVWYQSTMLDADADGILDYAIQHIDHSLETDYAPIPIIPGPVSGLVDIADGGFATIHGSRNDLIDNLRSFGDHDGDGLDDLFVGFSGSKGHGGSVGLFHGPLVGDLDWDEADVLVYSTTAYQAAGQELSAGRDVNGDGYGDVLVGCGYSDSPGGAYLVLGPMTRSGRLNRVASMELDAIEGDSLLGDSVSLEQDLDGDGFADIAVGAPLSHLDPAGSERRGGAMIWFGPPPEGTVTREDAEILLLSNERYEGDAGESVFSPGDINEDGYEDLIIGATLSAYSNLLLGGPR